MSKSNYQRVREFHAKFDKDVSLSNESFDRRIKYLTEEFREILEAIEEYKAATPEKRREAKAHLIKELIDLLYIDYGALELFGIDVDAAFDEVHNSNMSKTPNPSGKSIKGPDYKPADMLKFIGEDRDF